MNNANVPMVSWFNARMVPGCWAMTWSYRFFDVCGLAPSESCELKSAAMINLQEQKCTITNQPTQNPR